MRLDNTTRSGRLILILLARLVDRIVALLHRSCRYRVVAGGEHLEGLIREPRATVVCCWHERLLIAAPFVLNAIHRRGLEIVVLASRSRDAELVDHLARFWRFQLVRGSSSRGGAEAVRSLYRAMKQRGASPVVIPDGPRGPARQLKPGAVVLAQMAGAPVLALGFAARRAGRLKSWDRLFVPLPFTRVAVTIGAPLEIPRGLSDEALEVERRRVEALLDDLTARADAAVVAPRAR